MSRLRDLDTREPLPLRLVFWDGDTFDSAPEANSAEATVAAGIGRYRVWRVYLAGMALAFDRGWFSVAQILGYKPVAGRPANRPWSRAYQYRPDEPAALSAPLDWLAP